MTRSVTAAGTTDYVYAGDGLRVSKTTGSNVTEFAWDSRSSVPELIRDGDDFYIYGPGGLPVGRIGANPKRFVMVDGTGSVTMSTDSTGAVASSRSFDVWGNETAHTGTPVSLGWQSQYQDSETGFFYLRNRYYDPVTGQFTTPDALFSLTGDRYGYAGDDPLNHTDPLGLFGYGTIASNFSGITGGLGPLLNNIGSDISGVFAGVNIGRDTGSVSLVAGLVALGIATGGFGDVGILGVGAESLASGSTIVAAGTSIGAAYGDCRADPGSFRCFADVAAAGLATVSGGASLGATNWAATGGELSDFAGPLKMYADGAFGVSSVGWGAFGLFGPDVSINQ